MLKSIEGLSKSEIIKEYHINNGKISITYLNGVTEVFLATDDIIEAVEETMEEQCEEYIYTSTTHDEYFKKYYLYYVEYILLVRKAKDLNLIYKPITLNDLDNITLSKLEEEVKELLNLVSRINNIRRVHKPENF